MRMLTVTEQKPIENDGKCFGSQLIMGFLFVFFSPSGATSTAAACSIVLGDDGGTNALHFLVFLFDLLRICLGVGIQPRLAVFQCIHNLLLLLGIELLTETFVFSRALNCRTHGMNIPIKCILRIHTLFHFLVLISELLSLLDHLLNLLLCQPTLVICNGDFLRLSSALVLGADIENIIGVD